MMEQPKSHGNLVFVREFSLGAAKETQDGNWYYVYCYDKPDHVVLIPLSKCCKQGLVDHSERCLGDKECLEKYHLWTTKISKGRKELQQV